MAAVKEVALVPAPESDSARLIHIIGDVARDSSIDVNRMERLIEMQKDMMAHNAKAEFDRAFAEMQGDLPVIAERGRGLSGKYALFEDIVEQVRPVLKQHGFALRHRNSVEGGVLIVTAILSHRGGHSETDEFRCAADTTGNKNAIQAIGSSRSYGQRYTTLSILGIATRGMDDDGKGAHAPEAPTAPANYDGMKIDLESVAETGIVALEAAFKAASRPVKKYIVEQDAAWWKALKAKAAVTA